MKKLHKGIMAVCKVCTPDQKPKRRDKFEPRVVRKVRGLEGNVRRQMAEEIGEDELSKDFKFGLLQKYGIMAARIDRRVTKPNWMEESTWIILKQQFHNATKGLIPQRTNFTTARPVKPSQSVYQRSQQSPNQRRPYRGNSPRQTSVQQGSAS